MTEKINDGDIIKMDYTGRFKNSGKIFDTSIAENAKEAGIFHQNGRYEPMMVAVGKKWVIEGLDEALVGMKVGDEKKVIEITPEKAYGMKNPSLIEEYTVRMLKKQKFTVARGAAIKVKDKSGQVKTGKIIGIERGMAKVDFNNPLAGEIIQFDVKIIEKITDTVEKVKGIIGRELPITLMSGFEVKVDDKEGRITVTIPPIVLYYAKQLNMLLMQWTKSIEVTTGYKKVAILIEMDFTEKAPEEQADETNTEELLSKEKKE